MFAHVSLRYSHGMQSHFPLRNSQGIWKKQSVRCSLFLNFEISLQCPQRVSYTKPTVSTCNGNLTHDRRTLDNRGLRESPDRRTLSNRVAVKPSVCQRRTVQSERLNVCKRLTLSLSDCMGCLPYSPRVSGFALNPRLLNVRLSGDAGG